MIQFLIVMKCKRKALTFLKREEKHSKILWFYKILNATETKTPTLLIFLQSSYVIKSMLFQLLH